MRVSDRAIVLQSVRHGDNKQILKLFTREHGSISVFARAGRSPLSKIKSAAIFPLNLIEAQFVIRNNKEIHHLNEAICYNTYTGIHTSLTRLSIAQFLNEVLIKALREHPPNLALFSFIEERFSALDSSDNSLMNFHLYFLLQLCGYLGFEPQNNRDEKNRYFDCRDGSYSPACLSFPLGLSDQDSSLFSDFISSAEAAIVLSPVQRQILLDILVAYYSLHVPGFGEMKSVGVIRELMSS